MWGGVVGGQGLAARRLCMWKEHIQCKSFRKLYAIINILRTLYYMCLAVACVPISVSAVPRTALTRTHEQTVCRIVHSFELYDDMQYSTECNFESEENLGSRGKINEFE